MSTEEKARYDQAIAFLYTSSTEGLRRPSEALTAYFQYRDAHIKAQEEFKNRQSTAELSDDAAVQAHWRNVDERRLRQEIQRLEQEWLTQGFGAQVEEAQQVEQACNARSPSRTWDEWQKSFPRACKRQVRVAWTATTYLDTSGELLSAAPLVWVLQAQVDHCLEIRRGGKSHE